MKECPFCRQHIDKDDFVYGVHYNYELDMWMFHHTCHFDEYAFPKIDVTITVYGKTKQEVIERWNNRA